MAGDGLSRGQLVAVVAAATAAGAAVSVAASLWLLQRRVAATDSPPSPALPPGKPAPPPWPERLSPPKSPFEAAKQQSLGRTWQWLSALEDEPGPPSAGPSSCLDRILSTPSNSAPRLLEAQRSSKGAATLDDNAAAAAASESAVATGCGGTGLHANTSGSSRVISDPAVATPQQRAPPPATGRLLEAASGSSIAAPGGGGDAGWLENMSAGSLASLRPPLGPSLFGSNVRAPSCGGAGAGGAPRHQPAVSGLLSEAHVTSGESSGMPPLRLASLSGAQLAAAFPALALPPLITGDTVLPSPPEQGEEATEVAEGEVRLHELQLHRRSDGSAHLLGRGSFGSVFKARHRGENVACKVFPLDAATAESSEDSFRKEIQLLEECKHEHVVGFRGACLEAPGVLMMIMELMANGDLRTALSADKAGGELMWYKRQRGPNGERVPGRGKEIALGIAHGLAFLHSRQIVHLDLKSPNVLLAADWSAKVGDVGLARFIRQDYLSAQASVGTFAWSAPEVLMGQKCGVKVDVYSYGVVLWEIITGQSPHRGRMRALRVPDDCPAGVADLVTACLSDKASSRPSAAEILELLQGDPAVLEAARPKVYAGTATTESEGVTLEERQRLARYFTECNILLYGSLEAAEAEGYTEPPLESVVDGVRAYDGKSYGDLVAVWRDCLTSPEFESPDSTARARLEELAVALRDVYCTKMRLSTRMLHDVRVVHLEELAKLMDSLDESPSGSDGSAGGGEMSSTAAATTASSSLDGSSSGIAPSLGLRRNSARDQYDLEASAYRKGPMEEGRHRSVLAALRLTPAQEEAYAKARSHVAARVGNLRTTRRGLVSRLRALADGGGGDAWADASGYDAACEASAALRSNMAAESKEQQYFQAWVIESLLELEQWARAETTAFPQMFDALTVGDLILASRASPEKETAAHGAAGSR